MIGISEVSLLENGKFVNGWNPFQRIIVSYYECSKLLQTVGRQLVHHCAGQVSEGWIRLRRKLSAFYHHSELIHSKARSCDYSQFHQTFQVREGIRMDVLELAILAQQPADED